MAKDNRNVQIELPGVGDGKTAGPLATDRALFIIPTPSGFDKAKVFADNNGTMLELTKQLKLSVEVSFDTGDPNNSKSLDSIKVIEPKDVSRFDLEKNVPTLRRQKAKHEAVLEMQKNISGDGAVAKANREKLETAINASASDGKVQEALRVLLSFINQSSEPNDEDSESTN